ncbi:type III polyketide synthase [Fictibacillus aquaticus]|uniref:Type III polyketide synthase n=1 Tax=Fictibacillus aquaticus TaxID=2021314 RepID=A0A235FB50_9BACL|nr:3-oxoacyl-[acyl-carrier-protein] synthase III C-terminal domain-containing protein [Fictibacillus aquaticus]OYD58409.1 type III polyketide synthase [Fictibacillus aquaticus]
MPYILTTAVQNPPHCIPQSQTADFARMLFSESFSDIDRLLKVFANGEIEKRYFAMPVEWFNKPRTLQEKNDIYIKTAVELGEACISKSMVQLGLTDLDDIDAIFFISSSGLSTPSIEARIMNKMPFSQHTKRIPIWGLGCAGGAAGLARAYDYCKAYPEANVLVLAVELCSLTFQHNDRSKSNLVGTSLFADGAAAAVIAGDDSPLASQISVKPAILDTMSTLMPHSEDVMGWEVKDEGLHVVFSRDIPNIIRTWLKPNVDKFLAPHNLTGRDIKHFVAHPGGKKVLESYEDALGFDSSRTEISKRVLKNQGNMSSATVFYVYNEFAKLNPQKGEYGLIAALGPGFSSEQLLIRW